ncbi:LysR family transcriptional regulator [Sinorhizobium medicae]|uniref:Transcriptional regulator, LysR family n=1 Tax=Sinorhizobium medicae (strain WSM419) TaxID=366394 RepID=A6UMN5_SINMW|nr:LysR family transcriptional regulator [Sinorhizobium medicae]ABR64915.1 transcriptional regulator, LysR family [Sinorhizobium medicae WSM419]MBO1945200.1 LysR family transcriptional regulator [Sinorhizobium medicae]MDX0411997.1 LysR family transcriptional regulator [Sinorhizobium medicae]MDX0441525.1 LysR family transcriptional regulator [Sinorhizobium medicae]MDX0466258.1 LysR family transcriptional regulator [Sinorhizobium medicae]
MEHRLLQSYVAVAEELHFGRAAKRLNISQPPLTKQIQQLERELGVALFERTKRKVELTAAGSVLLEEARRLLRQTENAAELVRKTERGETGHLAVGFIDAAIYSLVPNVVECFTRSYPHVTVELADLRIPDQVRGVSEGRLDVGFIHPPIRGEQLAIETVLVEPLVVAVPQRHRLASRAEIPLAELANEALIQFPRSINPTLYDEIIGLCQSSGFNPKIVREATPKQTIIGLVSVGLGVSLLPRCLENLKRDGVAYRPISGPNLSIDTSIIYRSDRLRPATKAFINVVRTVAREAG